MMIDDQRELMPPATRTGLSGRRIGPHRALPSGRSPQSTRKNSASSMPLTNSVSRQRFVRRPEEIDAAQEAEEERRIAEGRERAADIRHEEDEEHHHVDVVPAVVVGAHDRPDHHDGRAGGADEAGQHRADREQRPCWSPGAPWMLPRTRMPPATVNSASSSRMNGMYSRSAVWASAWKAVDGPKSSAMGTRTSRPHRAAILP